MNIRHEVAPEKIFSRLIRQYHPDRLASALKTAEELFENNDFNNLKIFYSDYFFNIDADADPEKFNIEIKTEYRFDKSDFIRALNRHIFGGLDHGITKSDLHNLDGELDLPDFGIEDIRGMEFCEYLEGLNLSNNSITDKGVMVVFEQANLIF